MTSSNCGTSTQTMMQQLATAPVNWNNNDLPGWRPRVPFPGILDEMLSAGYSATEYDASFGNDPQTLRTEASNRELTWCGAYQWVDFLSDSPVSPELFATLNLLDQIDCRNLIVADSLRPHRVALAGRIPPDGSESLSGEDMKRLADNLHTVGHMARERGVQVRYHNHVGSWIEAPHELESLMTHMDFSLVDLCFDTGHYAYGGGDAEAFIAADHNRIGYLHVKDVHDEVLQIAREQRLSFIEALKHYVFCPIGDGIANVPSILNTLAATAYDGWIVVEQDTCRGDATETAMNNRAAILPRLSHEQ